MDSSAAELRGNGMADVIEAGRGMHPCLTSQPLEGAGEGVWVQEEPIAAIADQSHGARKFVERVAPRRASRGATFELFAPVPLDSSKSEAGELDDPM